MQDVDRAYRRRLLNANELQTVVSLLKTVAEDARMQPVLEKLRARGEMSVIGLSGYLIPLHHAVHAHTAPRLLLQRWAQYLNVSTLANPKSLLGQGWLDWWHM